MWGFNSLHLLLPWGKQDAGKETLFVLSSLILKHDTLRFWIPLEANLSKGFVSHGRWSQTTLARPWRLRGNWSVHKESSFLTGCHCMQLEFGLSVAFSPRIHRKEKLMYHLSPHCSKLCTWVSFTQLSGARHREATDSRREDPQKGRCSQDHRKSGTAHQNSPSCWTVQLPPQKFSCRWPTLGYG